MNLNFLKFLLLTNCYTIEIVTGCAWVVHTEWCEAAKAHSIAFGDMTTDIDGIQSQKMIAQKVFHEDILFDETNHMVQSPHQNSHYLSAKSQWV